MKDNYEFISESIFQFYIVLVHYGLKWMLFEGGM